jgi:uncharacterized protein (DUF169 family)
MSIYNDYGKRIEKQIRPASYPLGIKMIQDEAEIPPDAIRPTKEFKAANATCQCFALSRKTGKTTAQLLEDMWCPEPIIGYGLIEPPKFFLEGHNRYPVGKATLDAGATSASGMPRFEVGKYKGIVAAPLSTASFEPDVAVIYCNSAQLVRLLLGIAYNDGRDINTIISGHSACVYAIVPTILDEECHISVPCRGDRSLAGAQDDEMIFSAPKHKIGDLAIGLEQEGTGSIPSIIDMKYEHELPPAYAKLAHIMGIKRADGSQIEIPDE